MSGEVSVELLEYVRCSLSILFNNSLDELIVEGQNNLSGDGRLQ